MILRHPNCRNHDCPICLDDHETLGIILEAKTGLYSTDHLSKYRSFMDKLLGKSSETVWGWAVPEVFLEANIRAYVDSWKEEEK